VTVIDCAADTVVATVVAGDGPTALSYNPYDNLVYCANLGSDDITIIDGTGLGVIATVPVGKSPIDLCYGEPLNKVFCANALGSSISVLTGFIGIAEHRSPASSAALPIATIICRVLCLPPASGVEREASSVLLDISGRKVLDLHPGANDVRSLAPGVYFVREAQAQAQAVRKVIITR
jgi:YVTN family beta-propeller protein